VEPVWYLPGVAARFGIDEGVLRRGLFEDTGGSYPELITRGDLKLFLPPIGILTHVPLAHDRWSNSLHLRKRSQHV
jgi:hypothetical protein